MTLARHPQEALFALEDFIADAFTEQEFARILRMFLDDDNFLPRQASPREIASVGVRELSRHGCIDRRFFLHLKGLRRKRIREIIFVENQFQSPPTSTSDGTYESPLGARSFIISLVLIAAGIIIMTLAIVAPTETSISLVAICAGTSAYLFGLAAGDRPGQFIATLIRWRLRAPASPPEHREELPDVGTASVEASSGGDAP